MNNHQDVVVIGAGYVGLLLAVHMARKGLKILAFDTNAEKIDSLQKGTSPIFERGLDSVLKEAIEIGNLRFTEVTPRTGASAWIISTAYLPGEPNKILESLAPIYSTHNNQPPLIVLRSTIPVGWTRRILIPFLEQSFNGKIDESFFLSVCPERTLSGAAIEELQNLPQLVGGTSLSLEKTKMLFEQCGIRCISLKSFEAAELAKTFTNFYRFVEFNLANFFGACCHEFNINEDALRKALATEYDRFDLEKPSNGVGGFCLPKDSLVLSDGLKELQERDNLFEFPVDQYNLNHSIISYHQKFIFKAVQGCHRILALGIAFKGVPETDDSRESVGLQVVQHLMKMGMNVEVFDACIPLSKLKTLSLKPLIEGKPSCYDAILILNNHPKNRDLLRSGLATTSPSIVLYDPWRLLVNHQENLLQLNYRLT